MAQSKFTLYKFVKLDNGDWRCKKAAFYSRGKSSRTAASSTARKKNIPKAPTILITRTSGFPWAPMH